MIGLQGGLDQALGRADVTTRALAFSAAAKP
jgi:hypothetical protein